MTQAARAVRMIQRGDVEIAFEVSGAGPALVLLHGILASGSVWDGMTAELTPRFTVVNIDARGHGRSGAASARFTIGDMVRDVEAVLDDLRIRSAVWCGHSMGGMVALLAALIARERVRALVLVDTDAGRDPLLRRARYALMSAVVPLVGVKPLVPSIVALAFGRTARRDRPALVVEWARRFSEVHVPSAQRTTQALIGREDLRSRLPEIQVPTLVIVGEEDTGLPPAYSRQIASAIRGARLVQLAATGHIAPVENPQAVTRAILDFLDAIRLGD